MSVMIIKIKINKTGRPSTYSYISLYSIPISVIVPKVSVTIAPLLPSFFLVAMWPSSSKLDVKTLFMFHFITRVVNSYACFAPEWKNHCCNL